MEPILLYGTPLGSSMGLVAALEWLGKPYKLARVDMLGEMRLPSYARLNPRHETPALITDDGRVITETMAIASWLEARDTDRRISFDPLSSEADRMRQLMAFLNTGFTSAFSPLWAQLEADDMDAETKKTLRKFGREGVIERHNKLEEMIGAEPFLVGRKPTLADAVLVGVARWLEFHEVANVSQWPRLKAIRQRLESDPAVLFAIALEDGKSPIGSAALTEQVALEEVVERFGS